MSYNEHPNKHLEQHPSDNPHGNVSDSPSCPRTMNDCQQQYLQQSALASPADPHAQERDRVLRAYEILDSPSEEAFDKITRLAAQTFDVSISLITFIDAERQWFKSHHGTDLCETDLSASFCLCAVQDGRTLVVPNALEDSRFFDNPSVTGGLTLRYYVGAPLITPEGVALGTLCLIDTEPRPRPSAAQITMLETLASMVVDEMRLRRSLREQQHVETRLQKLLADKNMLLKEIHHRVKNNLQLVSSMLNIHSRQLQDEGAKAALYESRERIGVIAKVHELMYAASQVHQQNSQQQAPSDVSHDVPRNAHHDDAAVKVTTQQQQNTHAATFGTGDVTGDVTDVAENNIDLASLLTDLANNVVRLAAQPVALELNLSSMPLDIHRAIPLSLIVNELLTNAIKYAFVNVNDHPPTITLNADLTDNITSNIDPITSNIDPTDNADKVAHIDGVDGIDNAVDVNVINADVYAVHNIQKPNRTSYLRIAVSDNGVGLPAGTDINHAASLGFTVVKTLSEQIGAHLSWHNQTPSGLAVSVLLPLE